MFHFAIWKMPCLKHNEPSRVCRMRALDTQIGLFVLSKSLYSFLLYPHHHQHRYQCFESKHMHTHTYQTLMEYIEANCFLSQKFRHLKCRDISKSSLDACFLTRVLIRGVLIMRKRHLINICRVIFIMNIEYNAERCHTGFLYVTQKWKLNKGWIFSISCCWKTATLLPLPLTSLLRSSSLCIHSLALMLSIHFVRILSWVLTCAFYVFLFPLKVEKRFTSTLLVCQSEVYSFLQ